MTPNHPSEKTKKLPDFRMLISRLEEQIISQKDPLKIQQTLKNDRIWKALAIDQQLQWAGLAQMAGELETSCRVLAHINHTAPESVEGWEAHLELLLILGKKDKTAQVLACSRKHIDEALYRRWLKSFGPASSAISEDDIQKASAPFETLRYRRETLRRFAQLFSGREDCFARQWADRPADKQGYVPVRRSLEHQDLEDHFKGIKTYGMYLLKADGSVKTAVIDVDLRKDFRGKKLTADEKNQVKRELNYFLKRVTELAEKSGLWPVVEFSGGKGYHFWFFFDFPVRPERIRPALEIIKQSLAADLSAFNIEIFPKQDHLKGKGFGNLVKLPLGVHRLTGKRSYFLKCHHRSVDRQLDFLSTVRTSDPEKLALILNPKNVKTVFIHPKWEKWAESYPELFALESRCPPLGQIMAVCRNAKTVSVREEKILFQTIGFLPRAKTLLHHLISSTSDYNPHLVDYKLSRVRGTPLGCRRIHSLLNYAGDFCRLDVSADYQHPLLHLEEWKGSPRNRSEKTESLSSALENLKAAIIQTQRFMA